MKDAQINPIQPLGECNPPWRFFKMSKIQNIGYHDPI